MSVSGAVNQMINEKAGEGKKDPAEEKKDPAKKGQQPAPIEEDAKSEQSEKESVLAKMVREHSESQKTLKSVSEKQMEDNEKVLKKAQ